MKNWLQYTRRNIIQHKATQHNTTQHNTIIGQELLHTSPPPYAAEHQTVAEVAECLSSFLGTFDMHLILGQMGKEVVHFP